MALIEISKALEQRVGETLREARSSRARRQSTAGRDLALRPVER